MSGSGGGRNVDLVLGELRGEASAVLVGATCHGSEEASTSPTR